MNLINPGIGHNNQAIEFRPYQLDGFRALWDSLMHNPGHPVLAWPTGTGKSFIPAEFIRVVLQLWPHQRFMVLTHVKELIEQNSNKMQLVWPNAPMGIYSAGLKMRDVAMPIIFGGIASVVKRPDLFGFRDIVFIDECHLLSDDDDSMYLRLLKYLFAVNPRLKVVGLSATPYRMGQGLITEGKIFTHICHDLTGLEAFNKLVIDGWLSPLIPFKTQTELDISSVGIAKGEFIQSQLQGAVDKAEITYAALREVVAAGQDRASWLLFASGIEHAEHIAEMLMSFGIECAAVHSKQSAEYNDAAIKAFQEYRLRAIVNYGKLTTGFDHPGIDLIAMLRATMSVPLWVQMAGRGTRPCEFTGKRNCILLDFGRNARRLGPINDPRLPNKKGPGTGEIPLKICPHCGAYNHITVRWCDYCGEEFDFAVKIVAKAAQDDLLITQEPVITTFDVMHVLYSEHIKKTDEAKINPMLKATYTSSGGVFTEYVQFQAQHPNVRHRAHEWFRQRHPAPPPETTAQALMYMSVFKQPRRIRVWCNKPFPEIVGHEY